MRLANEVPELARCGAEVAALVVDPPGRNEAMRHRWHLPFPVESDPDGTRFLRPLDAWNPAERGGIAWPTVWLFAPDGAEAFRFRSRDFADRPDDADLLAAVAALGLPPLGLSPAEARAEPEDDPGAFPVGAYGPYFRGVRFGALALARRAQDPADRADAEATSAMGAGFLDAWKQRREAAGA